MGPDELLKHNHLFMWYWARKLLVLGDKATWRVKKGPATWEELIENYTGNKILLQKINLHFFSLSGLSRNFEFTNDSSQIDFLTLTFFTMLSAHYWLFKFTIELGDKYCKELFSKYMFCIRYILID
jgi:hypothetical protein